MHYYRAGSPKCDHIRGVVTGEDGCILGGPLYLESLTCFDIRRKNEKTKYQKVKGQGQMVWGGKVGRRGADSHGES